MLMITGQKCTSKFKILESVLRQDDVHLEAPHAIILLWLKIQERPQNTTNITTQFSFVSLEKKVTSGPESRAQFYLLQADPCQPYANACSVLASKLGFRCSTINLGSSATALLLKLSEETLTPKALCEASIAHYLQGNTKDLIAKTCKHVFPQFHTHSPSLQHPNT